MVFSKRYNYTDKEITKIINNIVILIDKREKKISHLKLWFKSNKIDFIDYTLSYGDYSFMIPKDTDLEIEEDIYFTDQIAIERKANAEELSGNFTVDRDRLKREFERSNGKLRLLIEDSSYKDIYQHNYNTKLEPNSFIASLHSFQETYNTPFFFTDKEHSAQYIYNTFKYFLRSQLTKK